MLEDEIECIRIGRRWLNISLALRALELSEQRGVLLTGWGSIKGVLSLRCSDFAHTPSVPLNGTPTFVNKSDNSSFKFLYLRTRSTIKLPWRSVYNG
jgi:hypothetical protein